MSKQTPSPGESYGTHVGKWYANDTELYTLYTLLGVVVSSINFGSFTGATLSDDRDAKTLFQELETMLETAYTILGLAVGATHFGTFSGSTLSDNEDAKMLFQELETAVASSNENILINQDFSIWQENITFINPASTAYTVDGYFINKVDGAGAAPSINIKKNIIDMEVGFEQCCELEITNVGTPGAGRYYNFTHKPESYKKYAGRTLTLSIRLKGSTPITFPGYLRLHDGTTYIRVDISSLGIDYTTYNLTIILAAAATQVVCQFILLDDSAEAISTTGSIYIQWMKLELGSVATPLIPRSTGEELALCQKYYQKSYAQEAFPGAATGDGAINNIMTGFNSSDHAIYKTVKFPVAMKAAPTVILYDVAGNSGKVTMAAGNDITGAVAHQTDAGFRANGTNGAVSVNRQLTFHYTAISRP